LRGRRKRSRQGYRVNGDIARRVSDGEGRGRTTTRCRVDVNESAGLGAIGEGGSIEGRVQTATGPGGNKSVIAACRIYEAEQERRALGADLRQADAIPGHGDARRRSSSGIEIKLGHEATVRARANGQVVVGDGAGDETTDGGGRVCVERYLGAG